MSIVYSLKFNRARGVGPRNIASSPPGPTGYLRQGGLWATKTSLGASETFQNDCRRLSNARRKPFGLKNVPFGPKKCPKKKRFWRKTQKSMSKTAVKF